MTTSWPRLLLIYAIGVIAAGQLGIVPPLVPALQAELGRPVRRSGNGARHRRQLRCGWADASRYGARPG
jgi:hypothetical protein